MAKRIMALDVGERRIGVAVSDPLGIIARGLTVVRREADSSAIARIAELLEEYEVSRLIVGLPRSLSGDLGPQAESVQAFTRRLNSSIEIPVEFWDERLSTVSAARLMRERGQTARDQKETIDAVAAAVILQDYLDAQKVRASVDEGDQTVSRTLQEEQDD